MFQPCVQVVLSNEPISKVGPALAPPRPEARAAAVFAAAAPSMETPAPPTPAPQSKSDPVQPNQQAVKLLAPAPELAPGASAPTAEQAAPVPEPPDHAAAAPLPASPPAPESASVARLFAAAAEPARSEPPPVAEPTLTPELQYLLEAPQAEVVSAVQLVAPASEELIAPPAPSVALTAVDDLPPPQQAAPAAEAPPRMGGPPAALEAEKEDEVPAAEPLQDDELLQRVFASTPLSLALQPAAEGDDALLAAAAALEQAAPPAQEPAAELEEVDAAPDAEPIAEMLVAPADEALAAPPFATPAPEAGAAAAAAAATVPRDEGEPSSEEAGAGSADLELRQDEVQGTANAAYYVDPFAADGVFFQDLACGFGAPSPQSHSATFFGAVNLGAWGEGQGEACGACVAVRCADPAECGGGAAEVVVVQVVDDCGSCGEGDINLSSQALR